MEKYLWTWIDDAHYARYNINLSHYLEGSIIHPFQYYTNAELKKKYLLLYFYLVISKSMMQISHQGKEHQEHENNLQFSENPLHPDHIHTHHGDILTPKYYSEKNDPR